MAHLSVAFVPSRDDPGMEILVNFGILVGRAATPAEIDRLAEWLLDTVDAITIVGEERHEIGSHAEATVHQVRVVVAPHAVPGEPAAQTAREHKLLERAEHWARACASLSHHEQ
jgi:hypothetical protein